MSKPSPRRLKKKKEREKQAKKKVLIRRNAMRSIQNEENQYNKKLKRVEKLQKDMGDLSEWADDVLMRMNNNTLIQLEKNAKILKALEAEYEKQRSKKEKLNNDLEDKGLLTLQEKLGHLHNELVEQQKAAGIEVLADELLLAQDNSVPKDVAEVTICKAPDFEPKENSDQN